MWIKKGLIYNHPAQLPTVQVLGDTLRIFYSRRENNKSRIHAFETDLEQILDDYPVLDLGERGCFDDSGVMPSCIATVDGRTALYYTGWNIDKGDVPYGHGIGLALLEDGKFERYSKGPILDRTPNTPFLVNSPYVLKLDSYLMWFCNGVGWDGNFPMYNIQCAKSDDGINWSVLDSKPYPYGYACSRPCVVCEDGKNARMWFGRKNKHSAYQIEMSYAYEPWKPYNQWISVASDIVKSSEGWDSEMISYPCIVKYKGRTLMFYNGNGFGESGIGYMELKN